MKMLRIRSTMAIFAAVAALFAAMSASAALLATNDFEEATVSALTDFAAEGDEALSDIIGITAYDSDKPSGSYTTEPWPYAAANFGSQYLSVDSGTNMVWRSFADSSSKMYFDSYVKFTPTSGDVEYPDASKFVIFLDAATSNLCVISGTDENTTTPVTNRLNATVLPESWGRITVCATASDGVFAFQVRLNGALLATAGSTSTFYSLAAGSTVSQVGFKGTGAVDDMVVRTSDPFGTAASIDGETFASLEQAAAEAEDGDVIALLSDSSESVSLPVGVSLNKNGHNYSGTVTASAGNGYEVVVSGDSYTIVDNRASTWTDAGSDHSWSTVDNWSTHCVPSQYTVVTLPDGAAIEATGTALLPVSNIVVNGAASLTCAGDLGNNWPSIGIKGDISGSGTLTLKRVGLTSSDSDEVTVGCNMRFDGLTHDSFVQSGPFTFNGSVTVTNKFYALSKVTLNGAVTVDGASTFGIGRSSPDTSGNAYIGNGATLSGSGRIVLYKTYPGNAFANLLKHGAWRGTLEVEEFYDVANINASNCGNANSIVCFNGVSGYLDYGKAGSIADVKGIEIGAKGLALNNKLTGKTFVFSAPVTGSGSLVIGTACDTISRYVFTGDMTGYSGALTVTNLHNSGSAPQVVFKPASATMTSIGTFGALVVQSGATVNVGGTWKATGGYVIDGDVSLAQNGTLGDADVGGGEVTGSGTITSTFVPSANREKIMVPTFGDTAANTFVINGMTAGWIANANGNGMPNIKVPVRLAGNVKITDGYGGGDTDANLTTFSRLTGSGNLEFAFSTSSTYANYRITAIDGITKSGTGYTGTITLNHKKDRLTIGKIDYASENDMPAYGSKVANAITISVGTLVDTDIALTVNGVEGTRKLVKESDGYYIAVAKVGDDYYSSFEDAAEDALAADVPIDVLDGSTPSVDGWYYDSSSTQLKRIRASVINASTSAEAYYNSLADAIKGSVAGDTVKLYLASAETGVDTTGKNFVFAENGQSFTGTLTGNGTITLTAAPVSTTWSSVRFVASGWTGTYVIAWPEPSDATPIWILDNYGIAGSTVRVRTEITKGYFKKSNTDNVSPEFAPAVYFENSVKVNDGYTYQNSGGTTKFSKLGMAAGKLYRTRGGSGFSVNNSAHYEFTVLEDFEGTIVAGGIDKIEFGTIVLDAAPSANSCVVKVERNGSSVIDGLASVQVKVGGAAAVTMPMVYTSMSDISGLYKAVAKIGADKYYATFQDALNARTAAGGSGDIIALDASAPVPEGYRIVDGKLVPNKKPAVLIFF